MIKKPAIVINMASGSTTDISDEASAIFAKQDYPTPTLHVVEPEELSATFETIANDGTDLMVVYGGDGTCKSCASVARGLGIAFVGLPGGTMNLLPKALYGTDVWQDALRLALQQSKPRWFPAGKINDEVYFCGAIIGDPINMAEAREAIRDGEIVEAIKHIPDVASAITDGEPFSYKADGKTFIRDANVLHISSPRTTVDTSDLSLEIASVPRMSFADLVDVGTQALASDWRSSEHVHAQDVQTISIKGQGQFEALLDGEPTKLSCPITISIEPKGVKALAP